MTHDARKKAEAAAAIARYVTRKPSPDAGTDCYFHQDVWDPADEPTDGLEVPRTGPQLAAAEGRILLREGPKVLAFELQDFAAFVQGAKNGEFDLEVLVG